MAKADKKVDKLNRPTTKDKKAPPSGGKLPKTSTEILASAAAEKKEKVSPPPKNKDMKPSKGAVAKADPKTQPKAQPKALTKAQPKTKPKTKPSKASSPDEDTESSFDEKPKAAQVKAAPTKAEASSSESDSSDDEDDSPITSPVKPKPTKQSNKTKATPTGKAQTEVTSKSEESDSGSSEESDSEEESSGSSAEEPDAKAEKKANSSSGEDDSSDSESESDEKPVKAKPATKNAALSSSEEESESEEMGSFNRSSFAKVKSSGEDESEEESSSDEESDESKEEDQDGDVKMGEAAVAATTGGKRKAFDESPPVKKVKLANGHAAPAGQITEETKSIFVGRLSWSVDSDRLAQEFASCGEIVKAIVAVDRNTGKSRGFGHVHFATASAVEMALAMHGKEIDGRPINVDRSAPQDKAQGRENRANAFRDNTTSPPSATLFVGNLSFNTTEDGVWGFFNDYGVKSVRLPTDRETGRPKGFGYVEFEDVGGAKQAFEASKGAEIDGRSIRLDFSQPRDGPGGGGRSDRGGRGQPRGRGRGGDRGERGGRGGRGGWRGAPRGGNARSGGIAAFEGRKTTF